MAYKSPNRTVAYGIDETIRLMRTLPLERDQDLVVGVVRSTLESMNVRLGTIIEEAGQKQQMLEQRISGLKNDISALEGEISKRRHEIEMLEEDLGETTKVKQRLEHAEAAGSPPPLPPQPPPLPGQTTSKSQRPGAPPPPLPGPRGKVTTSPILTVDDAEPRKP